jgi:signal transduction histidine kinase
MLPDNKHGLLWVSTTNGLVAFLIRNDTYRLYNDKDGLPNNYCYGTLMHEGKLWLSTNRGIARISPQYTHAEPFPRLQVTSFTYNDGLAANEFNSGSLHNSSSGVLYFGSISGITWFKPNGAVTEIPPPKTILTGCLVNGIPADTAVAAPWLQKLRLKWWQNEISFQFTALEFDNSVPVEYSIQLWGYDSAALLNSGQSTVVYTNLPPGQYSFVAKARGSGGAWGEATRVEISIAAPFWKRLWFQTLAIVMILATGGAASYLIVSRKLRLQAMELEKQKELEKERQRISREMHDDIGAGLTRVILMSDVLARKHDTLHELKDISHISRQLVTSMREIIWTLNPENSNPEHLFAHLRESLYHQLEYSSIRYTVNFPEHTGIKTLTNDQLHNILLVCKEAVNNAIIHSGCKNLGISAGTDDGHLWFRIEDDGRGFDPEMIQNGNGLRNMRGRITELKGSFTIDTHKDTGTKLAFSIPVGR